MKKLTLLALSASALALAACQPGADKPAEKTAEPAALASYEKDVLPADASPISYDIAVTPDMETKSFDGQARLTFMVNDSTDKIVVNGINLDIAEATLDDGTPADVAVDAKAERITFGFADKLPVGEHHLDVAYKGRLYDSAAGLFISTYPTPEGAKQMLVSQFEPGDARKVAPMWDEPAQKAVFKISMILPEGDVAISNMPIEKQTPVEGGLVRNDFAPTPKMSSYLLFFGAGDLARISEDFRGVDLGVVTRAGEAEKGQLALDSLADILTYYYDYFGVPFPLPKLDMIAAPGAGGFGAMENWGAILYFERTLLLDPRFSTPAHKQGIFGIVAHEVAHQWFGDLVTMAWWDDLWLNESFASWMANKVAGKLHPEWNAELQALSSREYAYGLDSVSSTHPVSQQVHNIEEANLAFDAITYQKGMAVIRMIEDYVGEDAFRSGVRAYIKKHSYGNSKMDDLWGAVDKASDAPVLDIAHDFTLQPGVPMIAVDSATCNDAGDTTTLSLRQLRYGADAASRNDPLVWRTPVKAVVVGDVDVARATIAGPDAQEMTVSGCGPVKVNAGESGYYRTLYADAPFADLLSQYGALADVDKLGLFQDAYALGSTGDAPFSRFLDLVTLTPKDSDPLITRNVVRYLTGVKQLFKDEPGADQYADFAKAWLAPAFTNVGWDVVPGESANESSLRTSLISALANFGDESVIAEARKCYAAYRADPSSLSPALLSTVLGVVASKADAATFDQLLEAARKADNPREQQLYYGAISNVEDEDLAKRAIAFFLSDEVAPQYRTRYFASLAYDHPRLVWDYYVAHYEEIEATLDPLQRIEYGPGIAGATGDPEIVKELQAFAAEHLPESAAKPVAIVVQRSEVREALKKDQLPKLVAWLDAHGE